MSNENKEHIKNNLKQKSSLWILIIIVCLFSLFIFYIYEYNIFNFRHNIFVKGPKMHLHHSGPAVLLNDGNVLIFGGDTKQAEIYDYKKNKFKLIQNEMKYKRKNGSTATVLKSGKVLITGGNDFTINEKKQLEDKIVYDSAELYNPEKESFTEISKMNIPRTDHIAIPLDNGNVLIFNGVDKNDKTISAIEEFDIKTNTFSVINQLDIEGLYWTHFVKIDTDKILLIGYKDGTSSPPHKYLYDYSKNNIISFAQEKNIEVLEKDIYSTEMPLHAGRRFLTSKNKAIIVHRNKHKILDILIVENINSEYTSNVVNNNEVIFIGGNNPSGWTGKNIIPNTYLINRNGVISKNINLNVARYNHQAINLKNGNILVLAGYGLSSGNSKKKLLRTEIYYK